MAKTRNWLTKLINAQGSKLSVVAEACNLSTDDAIRQWGKRYSIPSRYLVTVAEVLKIDVEDLKARMNEAKLQDYNSPLVNEPVEKDVDGRGKKELCEKMQEALEILQRQGFDVLDIAEKAYPKLRLKGNATERLAGLAGHLFTLVRNNENDNAYKYFFERIVKSIKEDSRLSSEDSRLKAIEELLGVYVACYLNPQSFVDNREQKHLAVNVAGLESLEETTEYKPFFAELSFRVLSHQRFESHRPFCIRLDLDRQKLISDGVNLRLGPMRSGDMQRQLHEFACNLARAVSMEFSPPQHPTGDVFDDNALATYQQQCVQYYNKIDRKVADALKIGYLDRLVKRKIDNHHPLLYIIEQCPEELISEINTYLPNLPIYRFDKEGIPCFAVDLNLDVLSLGSFVQDLFQMIPYNTHADNSKDIRNSSDQHNGVMSQKVLANTKIDKLNGTGEMKEMSLDKHLFICYARKDISKVEELTEILKTKFQISKKPEHKLKLWQDKLIPLGADWHETIQQALDECVYGLLMLSDNFLSSKYIGEHELPKLLPSGKALPVILTKVDFEFSDMKGLEQKQCYRYQKGEEELSYIQCKSEEDKNDFVSDLYKKILHRLQQG